MRIFYIKPKYTRVPEEMKQINIPHNDEWTKTEHNFKKAVGEKEIFRNINNNPVY